MTHRKPMGLLTEEPDRFNGGAFQPPQARSSMMKVAGASDDDPGVAGEQLITDDDGPDEYDGNDTVGAPVYEGRVLMTMGQLRRMLSEVISKQDGKYVLYTRHKKGGKRRRLGTHGSMASTKRQEKAIHAHGG